MDKKRLVVVIPVYNHVFYTQKTIDTLLESTENELTIVMVDDCSTDDTHAYAMELGQKLGNNLFYIRNEKNKGVNASWNVGIRTAMVMQIPYICVANNDLYFTKGWDTPLINALDEGYKLVSPYSTEQRLPADWPNGSTRHTNPVGIDILGCCFMFNRSLIEEIGYVPEMMTHYFGDNWFMDQCKVRDYMHGHVYESYIHHLFCLTTTQLDNNHWFKVDGEAYNTYCRNFKLPEKTDA